MDFLIGKQIINVRSSKLIYLPSKGGVEFQMAYLSYLTLAGSTNRTYQKVDIISKWEELNNGSDNLEIDFCLDEEYHIIKEPKKGYKNCLSAISGFPFGKFFIKNIDVFGYSIAYNNQKPTKHIILFSDGLGNQLLLRPEPATMGLIVTFDTQAIRNFFENSFQNELIYQVKTFNNS